jgi:hypothetical protein
MFLFIAEVRFSTIENGQVKEHYQEYDITASTSVEAWISMSRRVMGFFKSRPEQQIRVKKMDVRLAK